LAIAGKDIVDAIKNKTIQGLMVGVLMMMVTGRALPLLLGLSDFHTVVLFDEGDSELVPALRKRQGIRVILVDSLEGMEEALTTGGEVALGLVLPPGLDRSSKEGSLPALEGYLSHWARPEEATELATFFERELSSLAGQEVEIEIAERRVYPLPDDDGFPAMAAGVIAMVAITVGLFLVPYLLVDEKQTKTLDALLVSPASIGEVVLGKAIAGTVYCLAAAAVAFAFNQALVVNWGLAILATLCGALFAVAVGLLLGSLFDLSPQANGVGAAVLGVLLLPAFLSNLASNWPAFLRTLISWLPSVALVKVLIISFSNVVPLQQVLVNLAVILVPAVVALAVVVWKIRRSDR
jgi:ABC-2 type transport system permease protein